jgi:uncharacterized protein (DUF1697 family)
MRELRELFVALGHDDVATYIQSGNVMFRTGRDDRAAVAEDIRSAIEAMTGHRVPVVLRTAPELARVIAANPYGDHMETKPLYVTFLERPPDEDAVGRLDAGVGGTDEFRVAGREVYVWCPGGYGRTALSNGFFERRLMVPATTRNWRTVTKLAQLAGT